jgi:hypothetical protein
MALQTKLESPDGLTTISLKDNKVTMDIVRKVTAIKVAGNKVVGIDLREANRVFTITGEITEQGGVSALKQVEDLEDAAMNWASQSANSGQSRFIWGLKDDATEKDYRVYITKLNVVNPPDMSGGTANYFLFTLQLTEVGSLSTSG